MIGSDVWDVCVANGMCVHIDKGDGRETWLVPTEDGFRSHRYPNPGHSLPLVSSRTLTDAIERTSYEVSIHPLDEAPDGIRTEPYSDDVADTKSPQEIKDRL